MNRFVQTAVFAFLALFLIGCEGPQPQLKKGGAQAYVVKKGNVENPNNRTSGRSNGEAGLLCIEGQMYAYYEGGSGTGLAKTGETCPDVQIQQEKPTPESNESK